MSAPTPSARHPAAVTFPWWRNHGFLLGLVGATILAFLFPGPGARGGALHPELVNNGGIALILFLQGLSLAVEKIKSGAGNWRLHGMIQGYTFVVFPLAGVALNALTAVCWPSQPEAIRQGFLYLCVLPSTISTSVVLTAVARGNTAGALFNAALSNIVGVIATPLLVQLLMNRTGQAGPIGPLLLKITLLTLVPFALGMVLRPRLAAWIDARRAWVARISNTVILFIVYSAFCDSVQDRVWATHGLTLTLQVLGVTLGLFGVMSALVFATCRLLQLGREDKIAAYFCAVKKTLAMGVPLAVLIFGERADLPLILLPIMFYHPVQLFLNGLLANRWAREKA
ncbi:bile acid:sodium symporter [Oleiharenicola lentus]|uniref:Bile acid:sodium symporter n=1 Tax=Oleiharenicola lentus TaxID=2508720 RepID=A0A4Q1C6R6_9BACT|nr:bile acid:sodium symporter family protein [Oleiharenicola lentus]RXK54481.1 bile acid:sodium symporter [Oleiharenicola lentus]